MSLDEYKRKRIFRQTPEPQGRPRKLNAARALRFVIQEHHATRQHWDFRLEMSGVLKSWAVPKGPTYDSNEKRLAVPVEDHPLEYMDFEGIIPRGNYGAGTVMVWDLGTYEVLEGDPDEAYAKGKLTLVLHGQKMRGEFHLVRTKMGGQVQWLMLKKKDADAVPGWTLPDPSISVKTGRTIDQIRTGAESRWISGNPGAKGQRAPSATHADRATLRRNGPAPSTSPSQRFPRARRVLKALHLEQPGRDPYPREIKPMLATLVEKPPAEPGWLFEIKWDGARALAYLRRDGARREVTLRSRGGMTLNAQFPEVVEALYNQNLPDAVLDGEIVALDDAGRAHFQLLQPRFNADGTRRPIPASTIAYYVFDVLYFNGHDLTDRPLSERRQLLTEAMHPSLVVRTSDAVLGDGQAFYQAAQTLGVEGIVAKRQDAHYRPGERTKTWLKIKVTQRLDAVVCGFTRGRGARAKTFGAVLLGGYDALGHLQYIGHCGGGFTDSELKKLMSLLTPRIDATCPFSQIPPSIEPVTWVRPELVMEVEYAGWTNDGLLRVPVYKGLRSDKSAQEVALERPAASPSPDIAGDPHSGALSPSPRALAEGERSQAPEGTPDVRSRVAMNDLGRQSHRDAEVRAIQIPREASRPVRPAPHRGTREDPLAGVELTNLEKVFWPERGYTKGDLIRYYLAVGPLILPHLRDRPVTLRRFPNGITGETFYQKDYPDAPPFVQIARVWTDSEKKTMAAPVCNNLQTLIWLAQLADIEIHAWFSRITPVRRAEHAPPAGTEFEASEEARRASALNRPDYVVFDIDPYLFPDNKLPQRAGEKDPDYSRRGFEAAREAALLLRDVLKRLKLDGFVKTSGKTGLHLFVPIVRRYTFDQTHAFAKAVTQHLENSYPRKLTTAWAAERRVGKVFLDYNQNRLGATLASAYSVRPTPEATVSMPLTWAELQRGLDPLQFTLQTVPALLKSRKDPWRGLLSRPQLLEKHL